MRCNHCINWNMVRNTENVNNENYTLKDLEYGKKSDQQEE